MAIATDSRQDTKGFEQPTWRGRLAWSLGSLAVLLLVWEIAALLLDSRLFPGPIAVMTTMVAEFRTGALTHHVGATLARVVVSFVIAMLIGSMIGLAL